MSTAAQITGENGRLGKRARLTREALQQRALHEFARGPASWRDLVEALGESRPSLVKSACEALERAGRIVVVGKQVQSGRTGGYPRLLYGLPGSPQVGDHPGRMRSARQRVPPRTSTGSGVIAGAIKFGRRMMQRW